MLGASSSRACLPIASLAALFVLLGCGDDTSPTGGAGGSGASGGSGGSDEGGGGAADGGGGGSAGPVVETDKGSIEGELVGDTNVFLGVPFAAPPIGDLRWRPPQPHEPWTETLPAKERGPACTQAAVLTGAFDDTTSEDCLTLNVWAPADTSEAVRPVLVWIHGGAFVWGSGGEESYDGRLLSEATGTIVVTLNYRLGPFGFLAHGDLASEDADHPTNYGIEDQRAALEWVKTNIEAFGGDPERVTLFGESAGGISTCTHLVSPPSAGLFQRAIIESGPCDLVRPFAAALAQGDALAEALDCDGEADQRACLRSKSNEEVLLALPSSSDLLGDGVSWSPVVDGVIIPDTPTVLIGEGAFENVPLILGSNADEASLFFWLSGESIPDEAAFQAFAEGLAPGHGDEIVAQYPVASFDSAQAAANAAVGDAAFVCPTRRAARLFEAGGSPPYLYHFTHVPEDALVPDLGAFHSAEIRYVFRNPSQLLPGDLTGDEITLADAMAGYWGRLADAGDPNGGDALGWPTYGESEQNIVLDVPLSVEANLSSANCDFWDGLVAPL